LSAYPSGAVALAPPTVEGLTAQILKLLDDNAERRRQVQKGFEYAKSLSWEDSADQVLAALLKWSGRNERATASRREQLRRKLR
jgi:hypothetical protein